MKISIVGVPMDLGADRRGVDMGPSALRYADLNEKLQSLGYEVQDLGDLDVIIPETRHFGERKCSWHAHGGHHGIRPYGIDPDFRLCAKNSAAACGNDRNSGSRSARTRTREEIRGAGIYDERNRPAWHRRGHGRGALDRH